MTSLFSKHKNLVYYALAMAAVIFLLQWLELRLIVFRHAFEVYAASVAVIFTALGVWIATKLAKPKTETIVIEKEIRIDGFEFNQTECERLGISKRELEVLQLMASGFSNAEIARKLFVSENTVKTHAGNLYEKLGAKRRTQAVERGKLHGLIA